MKKPTDKLRDLLTVVTKDSPLPWNGDRYDGTVKYSLLDANETTVIKGTRCEESYGFASDETAELVKFAINALPKLLAVVEAAEALRDSAEIKLNTYGDGKACASYTPHGFGPLVQLMQAITALEQSQ